MTVSEAAHALGMPRQSVRKAIARRTLHASLVAVAGHWEYDISDEEVARYGRYHRRPGHRRPAREVEHAAGS